MLPINHKELSQAIHQERIKRNWTRADLASKLDGVTSKQIGNYESFGKPNFSVPRPVVINQLNKIFYPDADQSDAELDHLVDDIISQLNNLSTRSKEEKSSLQKKNLMLFAIVFAILMMISISVYLIVSFLMTV